MERVTQTVVLFPARQIDQGEPQPHNSAFDETAHRRLDGIEAIRLLVEEHGVKWVATILRNIAALRGEEI